jgi:hypothetical protein
MRKSEIYRHMGPSVQWLVQWLQQSVQGLQIYAETKTHLNKILSSAIGRRSYAVDAQRRIRYASHANHGSFWRLGSVYWVELILIDA